MTQETLVARINHGNQVVHPAMLDKAFSNLHDCQNDPKGYRVSLVLSYRPNMTRNQGREYKQQRYLLATFIRNSLEIIMRGEQKTPNYDGFDQILHFMSNEELTRVFNLDPNKSISHIDLSINFEKRFQPKGSGVNAVQRIDYILSYGRTLRLGGKMNPEVGRHAMLFHAGANYRNQYAVVGDDSGVYGYVAELLSLLE